MTTIYQNISPNSTPSKIRDNMDPNGIPSGGNGHAKYPSGQRHLKRRVHTPPSRPSSQQPQYQQQQPQYNQMPMSRNQRSPDQNVFMDTEPTNSPNPKWKLFKSSDNKIYEHKKNGSDDSLPVMPTIAMGYENSIQNQLQSRGELRITNNGYFFEKKEEPRYGYGPGPGPSPGPFGPNGGYPPQGYPQGYQQGYPPMPPSQGQGYQNYGYQPSYYQQYQPSQTPYVPQPEYKEAIGSSLEYEKFYNRYENHWRGFDISSQEAPPPPPQQVQQPQTPPEPLIHPVYDPEFRSKPRERDEERALETSPKGDDGFLKPGYDDPLNASGTSIRSQNMDDTRPMLHKDTSKESFRRVGPVGPLITGDDGKVEGDALVRSKTPEILVQQQKNTTTIPVQQELGQPVKIQKKKGFLKKMFNNDSKKKRKDKRSLTPSDQPSNQQLTVPKSLELTPTRQPQSSSSLAPPVSPGMSTFSQNDRDRLQEGFPVPSPQRSNHTQHHSTRHSSSRSGDPGEITILNTLSNIPILSNIFQRIDESNLTPNSKLLVKFLLIFWIMYEINSIFEIFGEYFELLSGLFKSDS